MHALSRSRFLMSASAAGIVTAAGGAAPLLDSRVASAQTAATTVASYVGEKMLSGALGYVGGAALGKVVASLGLGGPSLADISGQLSAISAQLSALQQSVAQLQASMNNQLASLSYQVAFGEKTQALIDKNQRLLELYQALLGPGGLDEPGRSNRLDEIHYLLVDIDYSDGVRGWYDKLYGNPQGGTKGLIELWGRALQARVGAINPATAKAVQDHFDYFDGQMAVTAMFNVELYQALKQQSEARAALVRWVIARQRLLGVVRGGLRRVDTSNVWNGNDQNLIQTVSRPLNFLPPYTVGVPGLNRLYYNALWSPVWTSVIRGEVYAGTGFAAESIDYDTDYYSKTMDTYVVSVALNTGLGPASQWHRLAPNEFEALVRALPGGWIGDGKDRFVDALANAGFSFQMFGHDRDHIMTEAWSDECPRWNKCVPASDPYDTSKRVRRTRAIVYREGAGAGETSGAFIAPLVSYDGPTPPVFWT